MSMIFNIIDLTQSAYYLQFCTLCLNISQIWELHLMSICQFELCKFFIASDVFAEREDEKGGIVLLDSE